VSVKVLLVDDQALVRAGFRMILDAESDIEVIGEASDGAEAVEFVRLNTPHVVLMDVRMPNLDGIEATRRILALNDRSGRAESDPASPSPRHGGDTKVLMLTTFDMDEYVYEALRAGASGFLLKDVPPEQLVSAIHVVAQGEALLSPSVTRRVIEEFTKRPPVQEGMPPELSELTAREVEVLQLIARGLSNAEIAKELFVSETTVKTHVARVLMKCNLRDRVQAVVLAYESGLIRPGANQPS
jgi:DNA-binding NarL/FixJ family response regulator